MNLPFPKINLTFLRHFKKDRPAEGGVAIVAAHRVELFERVAHRCPHAADLDDIRGSERIQQFYGAQEVRPGLATNMDLLLQGKDIGAPEGDRHAAELPADSGFGLLVEVHGGAAQST